MIELTELGATHGFTAGDLDTDGWFAAIPAYQKIYFADGRKPADGGYHKLDMVNTKLTGTASGAFTKGEIVTQAVSGATGVFGESITTSHFIYRTSIEQFNSTNEVTGADSGETVTPSAVTTPPHWLTWTETSGKEGLPGAGATAGCLCMGRLWLNSLANPNQWNSSRNGDPLDWLVGQATSDLGRPMSDQNSKAGLVASDLIGFIPIQDHYLLFGLIDSFWIMRSDPAAGGILTELTHETGMLSPLAYCFDDKDNLFIAGIDGIYYLPVHAIVNAQPPINITRNGMPHLFRELAINSRTDNIAMAYDKQRFGIKIDVTQKDGAWSASFWIDLRTGNIEEEGANVFPDEHSATHRIHSSFYYNSKIADDRALLLGCDDGYIRKYDDDSNNDDDTAIDAHFVLGPFLSQNKRGAITHNETSIELDTDSDGVDVEIFADKTAEQAIEHVTDGDTAKVSKSLSGGNLNKSLREKVRGGGIVEKISNSTVDETFSIEKIDIDIRESGRMN